MNTPRSLQIILDFDGTITTRDTIADLAAAVIESDKAHRSSRAAAWAEILHAYDRDRHAHLAHTSSTTPTPTSSSLADEAARLRARARVEDASLERVFRLGLFRGVAAHHHQLLRDAGARLRAQKRIGLRKGFDAFVRALDGGGRVHVVSVNWSAEFIRGVVQLQHPASVVVANEIDADADGRILAPAGAVPEDWWDTCGQRRWRALATADDKLAAARRLLGGGGDGGGGGGGGAVRYFGDSETDLLCLVHFGGIVIDDSRDGSGSLRRTLERIGYSVPHVGVLGDERIGWARDFVEVVQSGYLQKMQVADEGETLSG